MTPKTIDAQPPSAPDDIPFAVVRLNRHSSRATGTWWIWLAPFAALAVVIVLVLQALADRGPLITINFRNGQGLKAGDPIMYRGVRAGEVTRIRFAKDLDGLLVDARLQRDAAAVAQEGSRFWIVRPEVSLSRVSGLETLIGPRYIEAFPPPGGGGGTSNSAVVGVVTTFRGLEEPPGFDSATSQSASATASAFAVTNDLTLILEAQRLGSTQPGSPVLYRGFKVGQVTQATLSPTGQRVEVRVVVQGEHAHLVRNNARWWITSGIGIDFGLVGGLSVRTGSLESVISGGVSFATPDRPGQRAISGDRFSLETEPSKDWADWSPNLRDSVAPTGTLGSPR